MNEKLKEFKEMECPICHNYYFVDDTELEKSDFDYKGKTKDYCSQCGWIYDLEQAEDHDLANKSNKLSVNEYKKIYETTIKDNPNYNYLDAIYKKSSHFCPVCGKYEFDDDNSFDICPFCGWEDDSIQLNNPNYSGGANTYSLNMYKEQYLKLINEKPNYKWIDDVHKNTR